MKILITGVAGFIGSNLAAKLLEKGYTVAGIDNLSYGSENNISVIRNHPNFKFFLGDIGNPMVLKDFKADVIVHLASQKIPRYTNALRTLDENYLMLKNIIQKCIIDKSKIVFASTSDVYGKNNHVPFHEESDMVIGSSKIKRWSYALSKMYGEQFIIANSDEYGMDYTIVRFFGSYGPNQNLTWWGGPQSVFITKAFQNEAIEIHGDGSQTRTFTYIDDTIEALSHCILNEKANGEIFNIATKPEEEINILNLGELIWKLINGENSTPKINFIPYSTFGRYEDVQRRVPNIDKIKKYFNFDPKVSLEEGLKRTIEWQKIIMNF
jgi:UDP-glucose 4-epimerase